MYTILSLTTGALVALMVQYNGQLQQQLDALPALSIIHLVGLCSAGLYMMGSRLRHRAAGSRDTPATAAETAAETAAGVRAPWWFLGAGILGIAAVVLNMHIFTRAGILLALGGTLAGQTLTAFAVEMVPWSRTAASPRIHRLTVIALIVPGTLLIGIYSGAGLPLIALSALPGAVLVLQTMLNRANSFRWGHPVMLLFNYLSALLLLIPLTLAYGSEGVLRPVLTGAVPLHILLGGGILGVGVVGLITFLLKKASPITTFLGLYTGQLGIGILLDLQAEGELPAAKLLGALLVGAGLLAGELDRYLRRRREALLAG
jgi:uncharacterized membrane protein YdcZ (DUF606 family)